MTRILMTRWILVLSVAFASFNSVQAKDDHDHEKGPHGGTVIGFGPKLHIEAARHGEKLNFYVLGGDGKSSASAPKVSGGTVTIISSGKGTKKFEIPETASFAEHSVEAPAKGNFTALIKVKSEGKTLSAKFNFK